MTAKRVLITRGSIRVNLAVLLIAAPAISSSAVAWPVLSVCLSGNTASLPIAQAQRIATDLFASIGVHLEWGNSPCAITPGEPVPIKIELLGYTRRDYFPGALALCHPFGGMHGEIFDDRIRFMVEAAALPYVLGHVLAHEITHLATHTDSHSDDGLMKALWTTRDYRRMIQSPLPFTDEDILLIHLGLSARPEAS